jgi:hypothetical protein
MKALHLVSAIEAVSRDNNIPILPKQWSLHVQVFLRASTRAATTRVEKMSDSSPDTHGHARASSGVTKANRLPSW